MEYKTVRLTRKMTGTVRNKSRMTNTDDARYESAKCSENKNSWICSYKDDRGTETLAKELPFLSLSTPETQDKPERLYSIPCVWKGDPSYGLIETDPRGWWKRVNLQYEERCTKYDTNQDILIMALISTVSNEPCKGQNPHVQSSTEVNLTARPMPESYSAPLRLI